jgi:hypothetical protein
LLRVIFSASHPAMPPIMIAAIQPIPASSIGLSVQRQADRDKTTGRQKVSQFDSCPSR